MKTTDLILAAWGCCVEYILFSASVAVAIVHKLSLTYSLDTQQIQNMCV